MKRTKMINGKSPREVLVDIQTHKSAACVSGCHFEIQNIPDGRSGIVGWAYLPNNQEILRVAQNDEIGESHSSRHSEGFSPKNPNTLHNSTQKNVIKINFGDIKNEKIA